MSLGLPLRVVLGIVAVFTAVVGLSACEATAPVDSASMEPDHWVVVTFGGTEAQFDLDTMGSMLATELAADEALQAAEAGWIDGNDVGDYQYDLYFVGYDREEMWALLEPVFESAPIEWSRVELRDGLSDPSAVVLTP
jgi:hypothetical protein